jgi:steroid delta-isomerase-like uncharacterized protein
VNFFKVAVAVLLLGLSACGGDQGDEPASAATANAPATVAKPTAVVPQAPEVAPAGVSASDAESLAILHGYLDAWNEHDIDKAGGFLAEDVQYFDAAFAGMQHGRQAAVDRGISVFMRGVPNLRWEIRSEPIVSSDGVAYEWTFTGTNTGTWGGVPATNQAINLKGVSFIRFKNGKIAYQAVFYDSATLNRQLGL